MNNKLIITDVDGVILDWEGHFHAYMRSNGHLRVNIQPSYWQETCYPELSQIEAKKMIYHFNTSAWMMGLPALRDARSGIGRLVENGYKFVAITAMGTDRYSLLARRYNLENIFGKGVFDDVIGTDMYDHDSKRSELRGYDGHYWIEDRVDNAILGTEMGLDTILMDHAYNADFAESEHGIKRVSCWANICDFILDKD
jgi:FMN phosphatase YigB (HAD superfamily)